MKNRVQKRSKAWPDRRPWTFEMPVQKRDFTSLHKHHRELAVSVDLASIGAYGYAASSLPETKLIHSDFQQDPWEPNYFRYGSGRAGFYRGHYLKGIGRTVLAGNWNQEKDVLHSSGHLRPCAAAREQLITTYLRARGAGDLIVGCEGILVGPLDRDLDGIFEHIVQGKRGLLRIADTRFQAISVKKSDFSRLSNFSWMADGYLSTEEGAGTFFRWMSKSLVDESGRAEKFKNGSRLVERVEDATSLLIARFLRSIELGLNWNAYHNNFTVEGRFLDLEGPLLMGSPFIGNLFDRTFKEEFCYPHLGFELIYVLRQLYGHWLHIATRCDLALKLALRRPSAERANAIEIRDGLIKFLNAKSSVFRKEPMLELLNKFFRDSLRLSERGLRESKRYASSVYDFNFEGSDVVYKMELAKMDSLMGSDGRPFAIASPNTVQRLQPRPAKFFETEKQSYADAAQMFEWIERVETQTSIDRFLSELQSVCNEIKLTVRPD